MSAPIKTISVHLHPEENPHVYTNPVNAYEKGSFYCILTTASRVVMYPISSIWRIIANYETEG